MRMTWWSILGFSLSLLASPAWAQLADSRRVAAQSRQLAPTAAAEGELGDVARINNWTVGLAGGLLEGTFIRFAAELAKALDDGDHLRVLPMVTYGAAENISDLLFLKGVDVAITDADVFEEYKKNHKFSNIERRINYISEMYVAEFHVYARPEIKTMQDLAGKKVGLNTKGSAANITGKIIFERLGINIEPVFVNNSLALEQMKTGELAALVHTVGKPNDLFKKETPESGFHFLSVAYNDKFSDYYLPVVLDSNDYPGLLKPGEKVDTVGVPVVLAVYNWPQGSDRFRRVERFIESYFTNFEKLRKPPFHPKWKEINLSAKVPGWQRYWVAEEQLARLTSAPPATTSSAATTASPLVDSRDQRLYREFLDWKKTQRK